MELNNIDQSSRTQHELFYSMLRIRMVEEKIADKYSEQKMRCPVHLSIGQEAPAVGVCSALQKSDWVFSDIETMLTTLLKAVI